jgi:hypothetical protein
VADHSLGVVPDGGVVLVKHADAERHAEARNSPMLLLPAPTTAASRLQKQLLKLVTSCLWRGFEACSCKSTSSLPPGST